MRYTKNIYLVSHKRIDEMTDRGWILKLKQWILEDGCEYRSLESNDAFYTRLVEAGYKKVKLYEVSTRVRGYHDTVALVKR